jgi:dihydrofolate synthase / folylpolyglutamate synthase
VRGLAGSYPDLFLPLYGDHQAQNAAVAIAAVEAFLGSGSQELKFDLLEEGLATATSPGRLQLVGIEPTVLVDAAHNPSGAASLAAALDEYFDFDEFVFVIGILSDKDAEGIIRALAPLATAFYTTQSNSDRAIAHERLGEIVRSASRDVPVADFDSLSDALESAREWAAQSPRRAVMVTGSITLIGDTMALARDRGWKPR